jgi:hypothetical protein
LDPEGEKGRISVEIGANRWIEIPERVEEIGG